MFKKKRIKSEREWETGAKPAIMKNMIRSVRKEILFVAGYYRQLIPQSQDDRFLRAIEVLESKAEGGADGKECANASAALERLYFDECKRVLTGSKLALTIRNAYVNLSRALVETTPGLSFNVVCDHAIRMDGLINLRGSEEQKATHQCTVTLIRELVGNPFRELRMDAEWLTWNNATVPKLARLIYDNQLFEDMPILADALEDAGCETEDVLEHCRSEERHVLGCWVLDWLLGKK